VRDGRYECGVSSHAAAEELSDHRLKAIGLAIAGFGPLLAAAALVPLRNDLASANAVLVFVIVVVLASACGGWASGAIAAVVSTLAFDFFLTTPYLSFSMEHTGDIVTALLLILIGLIVAAVVSVGRRSRLATLRTRAEMTRMRRVAAMIADDAEAEDVRLSVQAELLGLLSLRDCWFEVPPFASELPRIDRTGSVAGGKRRWVGGELTLPAEGAEIAVVGRGHAFGRLVLIPDWNVGASIEQCTVAVALADQLGAALAAGPGPRPTTEWNVT
jgi:hypothetical protein